MNGETLDVEVTINVVGVRRAKEENQPFSGRARRFVTGQLTR
jgi:hypothetical protein